MGVLVKQRPFLGAVPYGCALAADGRTLLPEPAERAAVDLARELRAAGLSLRAVSAELDRRGYRARNGRPFAATQVARMVA